MRFVTDPVRQDLGGNLRHGDLNTFVPALWNFLIDRFAVESVLDVGCGEGHAVKFFHRKGIHAHGIDGLEQNINNSVIPIALHDLLTVPYVMPVDLVWSCEVAEHIEPSKVDNYLKTLANGRIIAMTHALPGQGGYNHVNCQPASYWIEQLGRYGYVLDPSVERYREIANGQFNYFSVSGLVLTRG